MDDDGDYQDGEIVWVKLSYCWWPGEVFGGERLTEEFLSTLKRKPLAVVKFFEEDSYEFVKNTNFIYKYNCARKHEFLRKGLEQYRTKNKHMEKFPADVMRAERATGGDPNIVNSTDYLPHKRESYAALFQQDKPKGKGKTATTARSGQKIHSPSKVIPVIPVRKHEVRILAQASSSSGINVGGRSVKHSASPLLSVNTTPRLANASVDLGSSSVSTTSDSSSTQTYNCHKCGMESGRQNVILVHVKYCRAVPMMSSAVSSTKVFPKSVVSPREPKPADLSPVKTPTPLDQVSSRKIKSPVLEACEEKGPEQEELVEVIQVVEPARGRARSTSRGAVPLTVTPKLSDRRKTRGKGKNSAVAAVVSPTLDIDREVAMEAGETPLTEGRSEEQAKESLNSSGDKSEKIKPDVELKNELLADWSEDEQDEPDGEPVKDEKSSKNVTPEADSSRSANEERNISLANLMDSSLDKSTESSPQVFSPVSSATTIKYRNIPKKQKREFVEVTNDQLSAAPASCQIEKSSSESSISTAATCGETLSAPDKTPTGSESALSEKPLSAKQRILDRATRGSSKSVSSDELKPDSPQKAAVTESQSAAEGETQKETSCFDFKEEEEEEVVLSKSPRRSLSNKRDASLELNAGALDEEIEKERAKKDTELKNEIDSLLCDTIVPTLPELPKISRLPSPGPSSSPPEPVLPTKEDRTLPPKERGKRIFKTRNKIIENEAIALEQSKAILQDFVKQSHEQELAELHKQQQAESKLNSESPTTTNDDSQESATFTDPKRFENSEFVAIKAKRTKLQQVDKFKAVPVIDKDTSQESAVSSSIETKASESETLPVSIKKEQLALDSLSPLASKGRKGKLRKSATPLVEIEKDMESSIPNSSSVSPAVEPTPKTRKKRSGELQNLYMATFDAPRSRRSKATKPVDDPVAVESKVETIVSIVAENDTKPHKPSETETEKNKHELSSMESPSPLEERNQFSKTTRSKRSRQLQQHTADSTADRHNEVVDVDIAAKEQPEESVAVVKQQPIKMIIKSKGRKSNSELVYGPVVVSPEPIIEEIKEKLPRSPKSSKRKKHPLEEVEHIPQFDLESSEVQDTTPIKSLKLKRPKFRNEATRTPDEILHDKELIGPSATDLQIAEALIHLPESAPPKVGVLDQEVESKLNSISSAPVPSKSINPRKRHLQTHLLSTVESTNQTGLVESVIIPDKKKRDMIEVVSVAPASVVDIDRSVVAMPTTAHQSLDEDKFDIVNIPIVMDESELLEDTTISTTTNKLQLVGSAPGSITVDEEDDDVKLISTSKPTTKKIVIVKNSNGSAKIIPAREKPRDATSPISPKNVSIKTTTITIKPPSDQLSPQSTRSSAQSPPLRSAQLIQASSGGQIVITSKGTVLTTQSPTTSTAKSHVAITPKTQLAHASSKTTASVSSVCSVSAISSSTSSKSLLASGTSNVKTPIKICVQSQEIIHMPAKSRSAQKSNEASHIAKQMEMPQIKKSATSPPKKVLAKKLSEGSATTEKPLFSTSKGAPITPTKATTSAVNPGKKGHRVIKISPQKLKEFTRLGMVEDKGQGKVLTASGMKKFRQEQLLLQQQQHQPSISSGKQEKAPRTASVDEEPSTSTPTPPPSNCATAEVVVAAAADSSVKEIPTIALETDDSPEITPVASSTHSPAKSASPAATTSIESNTESPNEENEADATISNLESLAESNSVQTSHNKPVQQPTETRESSAETPSAEATESGSNVQESSQLIAVPAENFGGPANLFYLCSVREEGFVPVNNELLYLDSSNQLVALPENASVEDIVSQAEVLEIPAGSEQAAIAAATVADLEGAVEGQQNILLNTQDGQQIILDQQSLMALAAGGDTSQLLTPDGQQILLQGSAQELLAALAVSQSGLGIVAAEGTQIIVAPDSLIDLQDAPLPGEIIQVNPNTTVETNAVLTKPPIMSTVEVPTKNGNGTETSAHSPEQKVLDTAATNLDESLAAVIGVSANSHVPTSLELPITVTNPVIAKTTTSKINPIYPSTTAVSAIGIDPAAVAATVIELPTVVQAGIDSSHVGTLETNSSNDKNCDSDQQTIGTADESGHMTETNGKSTDEDDENCKAERENDLDEIIPNTPESQMNSHAEIASQFSDDESEAPVPIPNVDEDDEDVASNCSEIIPIQPNIVVMRNMNNELISNNDNSSDMDIEDTNPGNEENNPGLPSTPETHVFDGANNSAVVER
ncbi:mucin-4-like isoform X2 [Wyeomyia smithii]|uniref:mucin-4-like isoform X2 n=1 Tax=Wyeomyia smithii TaxID=174621 RepID=UPI002467F1BF|nr:mucin-4-like isoform X2 [Wyeomyia smithii]